MGPFSVVRIKHFEQESAEALRGCGLDLTLFSSSKSSICCLSEMLMDLSRRSYAKGSISVGVAAGRSPTASFPPAVNGCSHGVGTLRFGHPISMCGQPSRTLRIRTHLAPFPSIPGIGRPAHWDFSRSSGDTFWPDFIQGFQPKTTAEVMVAAEQMRATMRSTTLSPV